MNGYLLTTICPHCSTVHSHTHPTEMGTNPVPGPGVVAMCASCFGVALWTSLGGLRKPTDAEHMAIEAHPVVRRLRAAIAKDAP